MYILDRILKSNITLIDSDIKSKISLKKLIEHIPNRIELAMDNVVSFHYIIEILNNSDLYEKSLDETKKIIIINLSNIDFSGFNKLSFIKFLSNLSKNTNFILLSKGLSMELTYNCELVISINDNILDIKKDRYFSNYNNINLISELRELSLNKILNGIESTRKT